MDTAQVSVIKNRYRDGSSLWWLEITVEIGGPGGFTMHTAVRNIHHHPDEVLQALIDGYPDSKNISNMQQDTPINYIKSTDRYVIDGDHGDDGVEIASGFSVPRRLLAPALAKALELRVPQFADCIDKPLDGS